MRRDGIERGPVWREEPKSCQGRVRPGFIKQVIINFNPPNITLNGSNSPGVGKRTGEG